jgi:hypothetical protein
MYNRQDIYNDFSDSNLTYKYKSIFNGDITASFAWYYGDDTTLDFSFHFEDENCSTWRDKTIEFTFYNFRFEEIYSTTVEGASSVAVFIDNETSKLFPRGIYYCGAKIIDENTGEIQTALGASDCLIYVK